MDFKSFLPTREKKEDGDVYWSFIFEPNWVQVGIWRVLDGQAEVLSSSSPTPWDLPDELINASDTALSAAIQSLESDEIEPDKTVFGVQTSWVENGQIKDEYLSKIKHICTELSLKPVGFVVLSEAISNLIKSEEGTPFTGIMLGVMNENVEVSLFKQGELVKSTLIARSVSLVEDVVDGLSKVSSGDALPSRFVLYNAKEQELEEARQSLMDVHWKDQKDVSFLHTPQIETISPQKKVNAVSLAGAHDIANISSLVANEVADDVLTKSVREEDDNLTEVSPEELGFVINGDVSREETNTSTDEIETTDSPLSEDQFADVAPVENTERTDSPSVTPRRKIKFSKPMFKKPFLFLSRFRRNNSHSEWSLGKKAIIIGICVFLVFLIGGFLAWWFYPKAEVTLYLSAETLEERVTLTLDPEATSLDSSNNVIPGRVLKTSVTSEKTKGTTGTKTVGDRATGQVTLYRVGSSLSLDGGSTLTSTSGLEFTLDDDITVASGSASTPGTSTASVTASAIGAEYNLSSGTAFEIDTYSLSDIEAKNESAFSGGSSEQISAVSEDDMTNLEEELSEELKREALLKIKEQLRSECPTCVLVEEAYTVIDSESEFSAEEGDEASNLTLTLTQEVHVLAVEEDTLNTFAKNLLADRVPNDYVLRDDQIQNSFTFKDEDDGKYTLDASIKANLLPTVDPDAVAKRIAGKYEPVVNTVLTQEIPGFVRAEVILKPGLPGRLGTLPHVPSNIDIVIAAEK